MKLRFIGHLCEVGDRPRLDRFGQTIELPADLAKDLILGAGSAAGWAGAAALLPDAQFAACGFTDDELKRYMMPGSHPDAPESFQAKKTAALHALSDVRMALEETGEFPGGEE